MTLPSSGQLGFSDINTEMGLSSSNSNSSMSDAINEGGSYPAINTSSPSYPDDSFPYAWSEWYDYDHNYSADSVTITTVNCGGTDIYVAGTQTGGTRVYVFIQEWNDTVMNGTKSYCITPSGSSWNHSFGAPNGGTTEIDVTAYLYKDTSCTGSTYDTDTSNGEPCVT
jgi:hypothetical protein